MNRSVNRQDIFRNIDHVFDLLFERLRNFTRNVENESSFLRDPEVRDDDEWRFYVDFDILHSIGNKLMNDLNNTRNRYRSMRDDTPDKYLFDFYDNLRDLLFIIERADLYSSDVNYLGYNGTISELYRLMTIALYYSRLLEDIIGIIGGYLNDLDDGLNPTFDDGRMRYEDERERVLEIIPQYFRDSDIYEILSNRNYNFLV